MSKKKKNHTEQTKNNKPNFHLSIGQIKKKSAIISTIYRLEKKRSLPSNSATRLDIKQSNRRNVNRKTGRTSATGYLPAKKKFARGFEAQKKEEGGAMVRLLLMLMANAS